MIKMLVAGQLLYNGYCFSCHGIDGIGALGPNIQGSSYELLYMKTRTGLYPKGYIPKRDTKIMPIIALSGDEIKAIEEYIK